MDFVTLPQLARELNIPERRIRHRFRRLVAAGKLIQEEDFTKQEFQDQYHFTYMIHPQHFIREAKLENEAAAALRERSNQLPPGTNPANSSQQVDNNVDPTPQPPGNQTANHQLPSASKIATKEDAPDLVTWLRTQIDEKNEELKEWRGLLPDYQKTVTQLLAAREELRRLGPGPEQSQDHRPDSEIIEVDEPTGEQEKPATGTDEQPRL